jgi:hypothetical protein
MIKRTFIFSILLISAISTYCQITQSSAEIYTKQAKGLIWNYVSMLNLISGDKLENADKAEIIIKTINDMFESRQVYVTNDVDMTNTTQKELKIEECLENIRLFYANSDVSFSIDTMKVSDIYRAKDFYFLKIEILKEMTVTFNNQQRKNQRDLDFYVKFLPGLFDCQIYSIKDHEDNLGEFTKAKISAPISFNAQPNDPQEPVVIEQKPIPKPPQQETLPKVDSLRVFKTLIKKQGGQQTFWGVTTLLMAGAGGYLLYESDQKYKEYQSNTSSNAANLRSTAELYNKLGPALLGVAGLCAIEFTIHTIKKGKVNNNLRLYQSRNGITLSYKF